MMISWVAPVHPSHPYLENDPAPSFAPTICAFHLGFSLEVVGNSHLGGAFLQPVRPGVPRQDLLPIWRQSVVPVHLDRCNNVIED